MSTTHVLVSGASIAGSAAAHWLRAAGCTVTVVERAPALRAGGQAVDLRGAGRTVVERMGLMGAAMAVTLEQRGMRLVDARNRTLAAMPADSFGGEGMVSEIEILRGDLAAVLHDDDAGHVEHLFDDTITAIHDDGGGVDVTFERSPARRFDLVIGADGVSSAVRRLTFGDGDVRQLGCHTAWFTAPEADLDGWYEMYNEPGGLVASVRPGRLATESKAGLSFRHDGPVPRDPTAQRELLAARFAGSRWRVPWLLDAMRSAPDFACSPIVQVRMQRWSLGRVVLVGDAGYSPSPLTGLGTSLALVGAYVLAGELAAADGDHRTAFARYDEVLRPYVQQAMELPPGGVAGFAPRTALMIRLRAASMQSMTRWPMRQLMARQFAKAGDIALPDYRIGVNGAASA